MNFAKGAIVGMMAGAVIGAVNSDKIYDMFRDSKKMLKKCKRKYSF